MREALVINTGPLIALAKADVLHVVGELPIDVYCPAEVRQELDIGVGRGHSVVEPAWLVVRQLERPLDLLARATLDSGEASVIQLALEQEIPTVCIDERRGRRAATSVGLKVVGTLGLLLRAKRLGKLSALAPTLHRLQDVGYWYSPELVQQVLAAAGES